VQVIEAVGLRKVYRARGGARPALDGLDLLVAAGGVHGFLGPNGSGKTTTLRVLLGLVRADAGEVRLFGQPVPAGLPAVVHRTGALIEGPALFGGFSGRRNLQLLAGAVGVPARRVAEVLEQVGLSGRADDLVKSYSLGMKQRLGIAAALMKSPDLLLLDEPSNGLDPAGIREVRLLIQELGRSGTTVLLSSHLLAEVTQVCDAVTIVSHGRAVRTGTVQDVVADRATGRVRVQVDDGGVASSVLARAGLTVQQLDGQLLVGGADPATVNRLLGEQGIWATQLAMETADLEDVFLALTGETSL
jgi:ABC-2 type transport system ATP-binding protein